MSKQLRRQIVPNLIHPRRGLAIRCGPLANGQAYQATKAAKPGVVVERTHFLTRRVVGSLGVQTVPSSEDFRRYGRLSVAAAVAAVAAAAGEAVAAAAAVAACHGDVAASAKGTTSVPGRNNRRWVGQGDGEAGSRLRGHRRAARLARLDANLIARIWSKSVGGLLPTYRMWSCGSGREVAAQLGVILGQSIELLTEHKSVMCVRPPLRRRSMAPSGDAHGFEPDVQEPLNLHRLHRSPQDSHDFDVACCLRVVSMRRPRRRDQRGDHG